MKTQLRASQSIRQYIKSFESLKLIAYLCPAGVWTIGWGTTIFPSGSPVQRGMKISKEGAQMYFDHDIQMFENAINLAIEVPIDQNHFDALVSFVYNIGVPKFLKSTLRRKLNKGDYNGASLEFLRWNKARNPDTGKLVVLRGLTKRRMKEKEIFDSAIGEGLSQDLITYFDSIKARGYALMNFRTKPFNHKLSRKEITDGMA